MSKLLEDPTDRLTLSRRYTLISGVIGLSTSLSTDPDPVSFRVRCGTSWNMTLLTTSSPRSFFIRLPSYILSAETREGATASPSPPHSRRPLYSYMERNANPLPWRGGGPHRGDFPRPPKTHLPP